MAVENDRHLFMECEFAKYVLFSSVLNYRIPSDIDVNDWLQSVLACGDVFSSQLICNVVYNIWKSRNLKVFQDRATCPVKVAMGVVSNVKEFNWSFKSKCVVNGKRNESDTTRKDIHVIHVDANIAPEGWVTMGCVIKDCNNKISISACHREELSVEAVVGEAMAIRWGLSLAKDLHLKNIILKSDAKAVVDCVNAVQRNVALDPLVVDIRALLCVFNFSSLLYHNRLCNAQAHDLARFAYSVESKTWCGVYPSWDAPGFLSL